MNGKTSKKLRQVAKTLPPVNIQKIVSERRLGSELPAEVLKDRKGNTVVKKGIYNYLFTVDGFMDHYENIKRIYEKDGNDGVVKYSGDVTKLALAAARKKQEAIV